MTSLTWLHLSDLHFRRTQKYDQNVVLSALLADVTRQIEEMSLQLNFIFVTGDIAYAGQPDEYKMAARFFDELLGITGLSKGSLFITPGNHDVDREVITPTMQALGKLLQSRRSVNDLLDSPDEWHLVCGRFHNYAEFVNDYLSGHLAFDDTCFFYVQSHQVYDTNLAILGLNTAWICASDEDEVQKVLLGERQARAALDLAKSADLCITLMHHPFDLLREFDRIDCEAMLTDSSDFVLHGHSHRGALMLRQTPDSGAIIAAAGACYETRELPNLYNIVQLDLHTGKGRIILRRYSDERGGFWASDSLTYRNAPDGTHYFQWRRPPEQTRLSHERTDALGGYLRYVEAGHRLVPLSIVCPGLSVSIDLESAYVPLSGVELYQAADPSTRPRAMEELGEEFNQRMDLLSHPTLLHDLLGQYPKLVVLGGPGSGKTTLVTYVLLTCARAILTDDDMLVKSRLHLDTPPIPILIPIRELASFVRTLPSQEQKGQSNPSLITKYLNSRSEQWLVDLPDNFFLIHLEAGECILLFDGLDEVASLKERVALSEHIASFARRFPFNRYVVTCRPDGYWGTVEIRDNFATCSILPLEEDDIELFVKRWGLAIESSRRTTLSAEAKMRSRGRSDRLLRAISQSPNARDLASNPLLLSVILAIYEHGAVLPRHRVELYERCVQLMLGEWELQKPGEEAKRLAKLTGEGLRMGIAEKRSCLEHLALWLHENRWREARKQDMLDLLSSRLKEVSKTVACARPQANTFLDLPVTGSDLIQEKRPGAYGFAHVAFQEYLAACAIADRSDCVEYVQARLGDDWWKEVILLTAGIVVRSDRDLAAALFGRLVETLDSPGNTRLKLLAGQCLAEAGQARVDSELGARIVDHLLSVIIVGTEEIQDRFEAGIILGEMGDPRILETMLSIPGGEFWMGSTEDSLADNMRLAKQRFPGTHEKTLMSWLAVEQPIHRVKVGAFRLAKYPVTNAQYARFVEAGGYYTREYWTEAGWEWLQRNDSHDSQLRDWQRRRHKDVPEFWNDPNWNRSNQPVVGVCWFEAVAYCRWLSNVTSRRFRLPTEAEWEKAARGDDAREWPWGRYFDKDKCNTRESGIRRTSPVGICPQGASPYGLLDMAGNVWEWCQTRWGTDPFRPDYLYPYNAEDGREDASGGTQILRVLRGGAWDYYAFDCRCASRYSRYPDAYDRYFGFRVAEIHSDK